jgi:hypothetical protein
MPGSFVPPTPPAVPSMPGSFVPPTPPVVPISRGDLKNSKPKLFSKKYPSDVPEIQIKPEFRGRCKKEYKNFESPEIEIIPKSKQIQSKKILPSSKYPSEIVTEIIPSSSKSIRKDREVPLLIPSSEPENKIKFNQPPPPPPSPPAIAVSGIQRPRRDETIFTEFKPEFERQESVYMKPKKRELAMSSTIPDYDEMIF